MKYLKYLILFLILCNIPSYSGAFFGNLGTITSYSSSLSLLVFFFFAKPKHKLILAFIILGILYYTISSIKFSNEYEMEYFKEFIRYMIVAVCAGEVLVRTKKDEILFFLLVGALSIIVHAFVFPNVQANFNENYGRFSGFYLNPNYAGVVSLAGYALSFNLKNVRWKYAALFTFTLAGILTFSRSFVVIWLLINLIAMLNNKRNAINLGIGGLIVFLIIILSGKFTFNQARFSALQSIFSSSQIESNTITSGSRSETWSYYYESIMENPILGQGYRKLQSQQYGGRGVHNSFLMVLGESGIIPFLWLAGIYGYLVLACLMRFKTHPEYLYLTVVIILAMSISHQYFVIFINVFLSIFIMLELRKLKMTAEDPKLDKAYPRAT